MQQWMNAEVLRAIGLVAGLMMLLAACDTALPGATGGVADPRQGDAASESATGGAPDEVVSEPSDAAAGDPASENPGDPASQDPGATETPDAAGDVTADGWTPLPDDAVGSVPDGAVRVAEFLADCPVSHRQADDPIVFPGEPGASHMHTFFGNTSTDAFSDLDSLLASDTTCDPAADLSAYWVPTLYDGDTPVDPEIVTFYYLGEGVRDDLIPQTQPMPEGLRIVAGNHMAAGPDDTSRARWSCLHAGDVGASKDFVHCPEGSMLESYLDFPQCWNGEDLDAPDHKSHMAYPVNGECPDTHPVQVPKLRQVLRYPVDGDPSNFRLATGPGYTMHGDFFNAWPEEEMARRVRDCIRPSVKCGADGTP